MVMRYRSPMLPVSPLTAVEAPLRDPLANVSVGFGDAADGLGRRRVFHLILLTMSVAPEELNQRVAAAYTATTRGELVGLTKELAVQLEFADVAGRIAHQAWVAAGPVRRLRLIPIVPMVAVLAGLAVPFLWAVIAPAVAVCLVIGYRHDHGRWPNWLVSARCIPTAGGNQHPAIK